MQKWTAPSDLGNYDPRSPFSDRVFEARGVFELEGVSMTWAHEGVLLGGKRLELISTPEWRSLCTQRPNVLLEGSDESTESMVLFLAPYLCRPVLWKASHAPFALPTGECGALVLQNVAVMGRQEQAELLQWLDSSTERKQIVSTSGRPLFPLVSRGLFDEALYYRLNVIRLCVDSSPHGEKPATPSALLVDGSALPRVFEISIKE